MSVSSSISARRNKGVCLAFFVIAGVVCSCVPRSSDDDPNMMLNLSFDLRRVQRQVAQEDVLASLPTPAAIGVDRIVAFEDSDDFVYLYGTSQQDRQQGQQHAAAQRETAKPKILRRVFFIRPDLFVIDDQVGDRNVGEINWTIKAPAIRESTTQEISGAGHGLRFRCRSLLPDAVEWTIGEDGEEGSRASHSSGLPSGGDSGWRRMLHLVNIAPDAEATLPTCSIERQGSTVRLEIVGNNDSAGTGRTIRLWIPEGSASGKIEIVSSDGRQLLPNRLLPAGILPPELTAAKRRLQWEVPYQIEGMATWDTKQPSSELKRVLQSGQITPCRAVEIGCGTGNDAIYLASQGFDVTAIDLSPAALSIAERKAAKAGVKVEWLLADVLHPPDLDGFDFVYDRGCYHEVRLHHARDYVASVRKLARDGAKILILAGNANKDSYWRFHGPPRVAENDIRRDFATGFRLLQLSEFRFDPAPPDRSGALAWSILLERKRPD